MKRELSIFGVVAACVLLVLLAACGGNEGGDAPAGGGPRGGGAGGGFGGGGEQRAAVPVEAAAVETRPISSYIETNGTLEAENDVDIVSRAAGVVTELRVEEMDRVNRGQLLARLDQDAVRSEMDVSRVALEEAELGFKRAERLWEEQLISREEYDRARSALASRRAEFQGNQVELDYTEIRAPFSGLISERYIKSSQNITVGTPLFRLTSFDPLIILIQVPEQSLTLLEIGQRAYVTVEAFPGERFGAKVIRISPVIDAATGTVRVTLEVEAAGRLRPGMFASVYLETETRNQALVIPKAALALDSVGDTVYVVGDGVAERREVELGFTEGDHVEVVSGVSAGERVVVVGQDGLSEGTPIEVMSGPGSETRGAGGSPPEAGGSGGETAGASDGGTGG